MHQFYYQLEEELSQLVEEDPVVHAHKSIKICEKHHELLRQHLIAQPFATKEEEILFFKTIKPRFLSKLIYYISLHNILTSKPCDTPQELIKYYERELKYLRSFRKRNEVFCRYLTAEDTFLDERLFTRGEKDINMCLDPEFYCFDRSFSTMYDHLLARLMANKAITEYIMVELDKLAHVRPFAPYTQASTVISWTDAKVDLVELIYALYSAQSFNHGNIELHEMVAMFEEWFNIELDDVYRTFIDIKARKNQTKFLDKLRWDLLERMCEERKNA